MPVTNRIVTTSTNSECQLSVEKLYHGLLNGEGINLVIKKRLELLILNLFADVGKQIRIPVVFKMHLKTSYGNKI